MKILIVDDNAFILETVQRMLVDQPYEVVVKESSFDAMRYLEDGEPCDFVITDLVMPYADGGEFSQYVRKRRPDVPILAITGDDRNTLEQRQDVAQMEVDDILMKPLQKDVLLATIDQLMT